MRSAAKHLALVSCLLLIPISAFAQASIAGIVRDSSGGVLPGVTVEASSPALIEKTRSAITDGSGQYRIVDLRPGTYSVTFTLAGFTSVKREGIELTGSFTATINTDLKVGAIAETITVTGETPVVDVQTAARETVLSANVIQALPATRAYGSLLNALPGLTVDDNGLAATPTMTFFSAHGGPSNEGRMMINGMPVAAAMNGAGVSTLAYDTSNVEEMSVLVSGGLGESETGGPAMNLVPRSGGNAFSGQAFYNTAGDWSRGDNIDAALRGIGITRGPGIISAYDASGSLGGPLLRDRLWFFGDYRRYSTATGVEGIGANAYALDPSHWNFLRDDTIQPRNTEGREIWSTRFTGQVSQKNRVVFSEENQYRCQGSTLTTSGQGCRVRGADWIALGTTTQSPEANNGYHDFPYYVTQATWSAPLTSRVLLEAGFSRFAFRSGRGPGQVAPDGNMALIPVTEQLAMDNHPANFTYRGINNYNATVANPNNWRASASYVTGTHNIKVGYQGAYQKDANTIISDDPQLAYRFSGGIPNQFTFRLPAWQATNRTATTSLFAQDTWTHDRLTVQGALRYDRAQSWSPAEGNGTTLTSRFNAAPIQFERTDSVNAYSDVSPRIGATYDLFGNGKTAIKFNVGRYLAAATNDSIYVQNNPANRIVTTVSRSWQDNGNFVVDCDILNPALQSTPGGDTCGAITGNSLNFGKTGSNLTQVNPDLLTGWGVRPYNWQWGLDFQQELLPRVSLDASYNRRWWGNFTVTDNQALAPSDYEKWTITAPIDSRLPGGGGYPITVYTPTATAASRASQNFVTFETDFGPGRVNYWQGVDLTVKARLANGLVVQGGTSTGRTITDTCATVVKIDSPDPRGCHDQEPYQTTLRSLASYTLPKVGVLISATVRSQPGQLLSAAWNVPNTVVRSLLGHLPPGALATGTTTVQLLDAGDNRLYADNRRTQIDMRFAKVLRYGRTRTDVGVDLNNLLNSNYATAYESSYSFTAANGGTWLNPTTILSPRFVRLNFTVSY
jgi:hypothetical protein